MAETKCSWCGKSKGRLLCLDQYTEELVCVECLEHSDDQCEEDYSHEYDLGGEG